MMTDQPRNRPVSWTRATVVAAFLVLTATAAPGTAEDAPEDPTWGPEESFRYTAGGATDTGDCVQAAASVLCVMGGGALCGAGPLEATDNVGGACTGLRVDAGQSFDVRVADDLEGPTAFGVCVDADEDGICRPDVGGARDLWFTRHCSSGGTAKVTPSASGSLFVFVMDEVDASGARLCLPTTGTVTVQRPPQCSDGRDNDGDGRPDYPLDPDCDGPFDDSERPPQCSDGRDNDGNGVADWPNDPGCSSPTDDREWSPQCSDGRDNDRDGFTDWPDDPGCRSPSDNTERIASGN